jgi:hypothetical protein
MDTQRLILFFVFFFPLLLWKPGKGVAPSAADRHD